MPSLKDLRSRITSVKSTKKITSAMKMVAASKLRRAQTAVENARPYATRMERMASSLARSVHGDGAPKLLTGSGSDKTHMLVVFSSDRGLCGGFNTNLVRDIRNRVRDLKEDNKEVRLFCVGRKAKEALKRDCGHLMAGDVQGVVGKTGISFSTAQDIAGSLRQAFDRGEFDICTLIFNRFKSAMTQVVTPRQVIPFAPRRDAEDEVSQQATETLQAIYEYEPDEESILAALLPTNLSVQIYSALLESNASEQGARMTAMDSATRNAGDMIDDLTLTYNRTRQAYITKELIEIISGAEAL